MPSQHLSPDFSPKSAKVPRPDFHAEVDGVTVVFRANPAHVVRSMEQELLSRLGSGSEPHPHQDQEIYNNGSLPNMPP